MFFGNSLRQRTTVGEHAIPERSVALASLTRHHAAVDGPAATEVVRRACVNSMKAKGPSVERIRNNVVSVPTSTS
jgi:hypothetical protein